MVVFDHGQPKVEHREDINFYTHTGYSADLSTFPAGTALPSNNTSSTLPTKRLRWPQRIYHQLFHWFRQLPSPYYDWGRWLQQFSKMMILSLKGHNSGRIGLFMVESTKIAIYDQVDADIYMFPGYSYVAAELAFYCRQKGKIYFFGRL
ncbi:MAG: hypothetical protein HC875_05790 [Anaerolineales bacterium]|nr:hypothetical protein [Anaerolineales bacterium]